MFAGDVVDDRENTVKWRSYALGAEIRHFSIVYLESFSIPSSVTIINDSAFYNCLTLLLK